MKETCKFCGVNTDALTNLVNIRGAKFHMKCFFENVSDERYKEISKTVNEILKLEEKLQELIG